MTIVVISIVSLNNILFMFFLFFFLVLQLPPKCLRRSPGDCSTAAPVPGQLTGWCLGSLGLDRV